MIEKFKNVKIVYSDNTIKQTFKDTLDKSFYEKLIKEFENDIDMFQIFNVIFKK